MSPVTVSPGVLTSKQHFFDLAVSFLLLSSRADRETEGFGLHNHRAVAARPNLHQLRDAGVKLLTQRCGSDDYGSHFPRISERNSDPGSTAVTKSWSRARVQAT